jgi:hypothetical protein
MSRKPPMAVIIQSLLLASVIVAPLWRYGGAAFTQTDQQSVDVHHQAEIKDLLAVLREKQIREREPEPLKNAIVRLRELKAAEASDDLAALLDFKWPKELVHGGSHEGDGYWAKSALVQIGKPALPALVKTLEATDTATIKFKNATETVMNIFRDNRVEGPLFLRQAAKKSQTPLGAQRLNTAAAYLEAINATLPPQPPKPH